MFFLRNNVLLLYVLLHYLCLHKMMLLSFVFLWFFNAHWIYWCNLWSCLHFCMPTLSISMQKLNCRSSNCIYMLNYCLCKLYLHIICLPFCTFWRWWWMWQRPYSQWLNIQQFFYFCYFQLLFYFCSYQQLCFRLLPSFVLTPLSFFFPYYLL